MGVKSEMSDVVNDSVQCLCGYIFHGDDLDQESGKRKPCPKCGLLKRSLHKKVEANISVKVGVSGMHEVHMSPQSWAIFGLLVGFVIPPIFYAVFSMLTIGFWYKLLIWLGVILILGGLIRIPLFIIFLRFLGNIAYGKHKI